MAPKHRQRKTRPPIEPWWCFDEECVVCLDEGQKVAFIPCGHMLCESCASNNDAYCQGSSLPERVCHTCRSVIKGLITVR